MRAGVRTVRGGAGPRDDREKTTPAVRGRSGGGHALSREVHPQEDRGVVAGAARLPHRPLGLRDLHHRPAGRRADERRIHRGEGRPPAGGRRARRPGRATADPGLPRRSPGLRRAPRPHGPTRHDRPRRGRGQGERPGAGRPGGADRLRRRPPGRDPQRRRRTGRPARIGREAHHQPGEGAGLLQRPRRPLVPLPQRTPHPGERVDGQADAGPGRGLPGPRFSRARTP